MPFTAEDARWMARALRLARRGLWTTDPNPRVGCVLVRGGRAVGEGWHERAGGPHAEVAALAAAGDAARGATCYVTLEPCAHHGRTPPCADALVAAGVARVVAAMEDPNPQVAGEGLARLRAAGIEAEAGLMAAEAEALNPGFLKRMRAGLPWVRVKLAASLDGRTAMASGESRWITSAQARADVHRLRARSSVVLTGSGTVRADDPALTARPGGAPAARQPLRVVLDSALATPPGARLFREPGPVLILAAREDAGRRRALEAAGAEVAVAEAATDGRVALEAALRYLARREANEVLVEAGPTLAGAFVAAGLADELVVYLAPHLMGDAARGMFALPGLERMEQRLALEIVETRAVGPDLRITARPRKR